MRHQAGWENSDQTAFEQLALVSALMPPPPLPAPAAAFTHFRSRIKKEFRYVQMSSTVNHHVWLKVHDVFSCFFYFSAYLTAFVITWFP